MDFERVNDPLDVVEQWKGEAERQGSPHSDAMTLCTVGEDGSPQGRIVLLKGRQGRTVHFYTNYQSPKGRELERDSRATLVLFFPHLGRQARIQGRTIRLSAAQSDAYFATRPRLSQLGAWASEQSLPLASRAELERRVAAVEALYAGGEVPRPPHWGGYGLEADLVELWVASEGRLHDRARFVFRERWSPAQLLNP